ncbi:polyhomeotic-like protein 1 isoform X3 [Bufo gargarizans]|uniref:polyhomeotic-like protein 1 isoform X3 n=1 Tax=Bufo gargarizans TaxID=30331 RepID=UPI001CF563E4|nr:polyhomeotic-like protein 1 isoform X3 [Bufo gargarizans]
MGCVRPVQTRKDAWVKLLFCLSFGRGMPRGLHGSLFAYITLRCKDPRFNMETESEQNSTSTNGSTASSASSRPQISQMSLYERQAVQALQALHRQPNAAQYFHQLMLQQQLSNAQLHSLAAVQQATIAATRQAASPNNVSNQQTSTTQGSQVNLSTSSSAQLLSRAQNVTAPSATTLTQSVLLSNASSPPLNQSQTQMYLRQQPQLGNLLQVNRSLNRGVPLNPQLILMPNGSVATVQQEVASPQNQNMHQDSDQVQNLAVRGQQTAQPMSTAAGPTIAHAAPPQSKPTTHPMPPSSAPSQLPSSPVPQTVKSPMGPAGGTVSQGSQTEAEVRKAEGEAVQQSVGINLTRAATPAPNQTLISSATYTHIQPHSVLQQKQVVFQQQIAIHQHRQSQLVHTSAHVQLAQQQPQAPSQQGLQANPAQQTLVVQPMLQTTEVTLPTKAPVPIQPKQPGKGVPPLNLGHLAGKPTQSARPLPTPPPNQPHIPVQLVGARQQGPAQALALGAPQVPSQGSSLTQITLPPSPAPVPTAVSGAVHEAQAAFYGVLQGKMSGVGGKRNTEAEEGRDESPTLPVKASPPADTPPTVEESSTPADKSEAASQVSPALTVSAPPCAPTLSVTSRQHSDSKPPQAIVKPQILTHIIEGFVIQEGAEPFPVGSPQIPKDPEKVPTAVTVLPPVESPPPHPPVDQTVSDSITSKLLKCEYCGKFAPADQFRGTKRFCSMTCAKRYNVSCSHQFRLKRKKLNPLQDAGGVRVRRRGPRRNSSEIARAKIQGKRMREDSSRGSDNSSYEEAFSPTSPAPPSCRTPQRERDGSTPTSGPSNSELLGINPVFLSSNPSRWSVEEVYEFISSLPGCQDLAEDFRSQEIDGQALLLLKEEHLMSALNIKLGPALKICAKINLLKET